MRLLTVNKRVTSLENSLNRLKAGQKNTCRLANEMDDSTLPVLTQLQKLALETKRIKEETVASGDHRSALACVRELSHILELIAKLGGELDEKTQTNILQLNIDAGTGERIAQMYLARLKK
jgi:hypothetical protein